MRGAYVLMIFLFITHIFSGFSSAPPLGRTGAPGDGMCTDCHGGNNSQGLEGSVQILGLPAEVTPNTTYRVTVEVASLNGLSRSAGMQMVALKSDDTAAGTFSNPSIGGAISPGSGGRSYLGHRPAQNYDANGIVTWEVDWTTPADTDPNVTFYAVGNVTDMDNGSNTANDLIIFETESTEIIDPVMELPDLFASDVVGFSGTFAPDEVAEFTWNLNNNSNVVATESYRIAMFLSDDTQFSADDPLVGEVPTGNTFPGVIPNVPGAIRIPANAVDGEYYLHFLVDADGVIEESDENNNLLTTSTTITVETPQVTPLIFEVLTVNNCDGSAELTAFPFGGVPPYSYLWSTGETTQSILVDVAGDFVLTITDEGGSLVEVELPVELFDVLSAEVIVNEQPACGALGSVSIVAESAFEPTVIEWSDGFIGADRDDLEPGAMTATVTDDKGCVLVLDVVLDGGSDILLNAAVTQLTCPGDEDASIVIAATGGSDNYTYSWSNQATTSSIDGLPAGTYSVTVDDGGSCQAVESFVITMLQPIELVSTVTEISCAGESDGAISVLAIGGTGPYQYIWSNNITTNNNLDLSAGTYRVTVVDANSCQFSEEFEIVEAPAIVVQIDKTDVTCFGGMDGSYSAQIQGEPSSLQEMDNLAPGVYPVTLTSANGCSVMESIIISEPGEISTVSSVDDVICFGEANGSIRLAQVLGGISPYTFDWSNGLSSLTIEGLVAGPYEVTITDALGCTRVEEFVVSEPDELTLTGNSIFAAGDNSSINIEVSGGALPYTYMWSNGEVTQDIFDLPEGIYEVTVIDANGCALMESFDIISTSVQTIDELTSLNLYPTPTQNVLNVELTLSNAVAFSAKIYSLNGAYQEVVKTEFSARTGQQKSQIDVRHLDAGLYMLVLQSEAGVVAKRFVKL